MRKVALLWVSWLIITWVSVAQAQTILVVGDSISAAYGIDINDGWVTLLEQRLAEDGLSYQVVNASISGDTSAGGRYRLPALLERHQPELVILELGGNDGLRGLPLTNLQDNLLTMSQLAKAQGAQVLLLGMRIPPNYGPRYTEGFYQVYQHVAAQEQLPLVAFFLDGVGGDSELVQLDGIHPTAQAQPILLDNAWPAIQALLLKQP